MKAPPPNIIANSQTLWMGDLEPFMDESYLSNVFTTAGLRSSIKSIKVIKDKGTYSSSGYGFIEFNSHQTAQSVLDSYNGTPIPGTKKNFVFKWGAYGAGTKPQNLNWKSIQKVSVFVGDLDSSVNDKQLLEFFSEKYPSAYFARIIYDPVTKYSKSYGFVEFSNATEAQRAITEMTGMILAGRMIRVSNANTKNTGESQTALTQSNPGDDSEMMHLAFMQKQQLYQYYYSIVDDPLLKMEYQRQLEHLSRMDLLKNVKKKSLKNDLDSLGSLQLADTRASEPFLEDLPNMVCYKGKLDALTRIYS